MEFKDRLLEVIEERFSSQARFADLLKVSRQSLHSVLTNGSPSVKFLMSLREHVPDINLNWLLFGRGEKYLSEAEMKQHLIEEGRVAYGKDGDEMVVFLKEMVGRLQDQVTELQRALIEKGRQKGT